MTTTADQRGWGNPRSATFEADIRSRCVVVDAGGIKVRLHRDVADIFRYANTRIAEHYNLAGYADDYGLAIRPIRGYEQQWAATHDPRYLSNHSYGLAEDLDSSVNPMTKDLQAHHEFIHTVLDPILAPFEGRLVWGGEYSGPRKDYMHLEYIGTPEQATTDSALARRLLEELLHPQTDTPPRPIAQEDEMQLLNAGIHRPIAVLRPDGTIRKVDTNALRTAYLNAGAVEHKISTDDFDLIASESAEIAKATS